MKKILPLFFIGVLMAGGLLPLLALAATANVNNCADPQGLLTGITCVGSQIAGPGGLSQDASAGAILKRVILWLLSLVAVLALLAFIVGGIMYIISFGDEGRAERAKNIILYAVIGLLVVGASFLIIQVIGTFLRGGAPGAGGGGAFLPVAWAQNIDDTKGFQGGITFIKGNILGQEKSGIKDFDGDVVGFITAGLKIILSFVAIIAAVVLIWGGVKYIISLGDEDKAADAKRLILYAIIGLLIIGMAALVVNIITGIYRT